MPPCHSPRRCAWRARPRLEALEDRTVPSTMSPLAAKSPLGSLLYESSGAGQITAANPTDAFSFDLDAGQSLSVAITPYMFGGHWYTLTSGPLNWQQAEAEAVALGGHLVTVNSQAEQDFLTATFFSGENERRMLWIGLNDVAVEGNFVWSSGEPVTFTNWCAFEPNNGSGVEEYVTLNYHYANGIGDPGQWNDEPLGGASGGGLFGIIELSDFAPLQPSVTVTGPDGPVALPPDAAPGDEVLLQDIPITTAGAYTVSVAGVGGSTGKFQARALVNGALEAEAAGGADNGTRATAQDLDGSFRSVAGGRHAAASGSLPPNRGIALASDDFERASLGAGWSTYSSLSTGRIQLTNSYTPAAGGKSLVMDDSKARGTAGLNEAVWTVNLAGQSQAALSFLHATWNDEVTALPDVFTEHANGDGIAISADGITWYTAWAPPGQPAGVWWPYTIDLAAVAARNGISLGSTFQIKFQQYGADPLTNDGRGWDRLRLLVPDAASTANEDWYKFTLSAGEAATVTVTPQGSSAAHVQIYDANGVKLYNGDPAPTNVGEAVTFTAPTAGTYYARVSNNVYTPTGADYALTVTAGAAFDLEDNSGPRPWAGGTFQELGASQGALGALASPVTTIFVSSGSGGLLASEKIAFYNGDLFVVSRNNAAIRRYDGTTGAPKPSSGNSGALFASGNGLSNPIGIDFGPDGNLYVANYSTNTVVRFDGSSGAGLGTFVTAGSGGLTGATGLVFGPDGHLYVSSRDSDQVMRYDGSTGAALPSAGNTGAVFAQGGGLDGPDGLTFGPDGKLYVSSQFNDQVIRYEGGAGGSPETFVSAGSGGLVQPLDPRFGPDGDFYVTSYGTGEVLSYQGLAGASPGAFRGVAVPGQPALSDPTGLTFGPDAALYVTSRGQSSVLRVSGHSDFYRVTLNPGDLLTAQSATPFGGPLQLLNELDPMLRLYDSAGALLVADDDSASELRNARLLYQSTAGGDYYVEVTSGGFSTGEYVLDTAVHPAGTPLLVIDHVSLLEGDSGTTSAQLTVTLLNPPASGDVTIDYATADGTALAGSDYTTTTGTLTFPAGGPATRTISVPVTADLVEEAHEYFFVRLSNATGAAIAFDGRARATVLNEDTTVSVGPARAPAYWADSGHYYTLTSAQLTWQAAEAEAIALGGHLVTINSQAEEAFLDATFISGVSNPPPYWIGLNDQAVEGTFVWASGEAVTYTNWLSGEPNNQNDEDYAIIRVPPLGWNDAHGTDLYYGIIELPTFTGDAILVEGHTGTRNATFTLTLSTASALPVSVQYRTDDGSATAASGDYVAVPPTTVTFQPGETTKTITVAVNGDTAVEGNETFLVNLSNAAGATIADGQGVGTIANDDNPASPNDIYVWDITHETRLRGGKTDLRVLVTVRRDSDADGVAEASDAAVSGASVTVQLTGPANTTLSGTTSSTGQFVSSWVSNVAGTYVAEVSNLQSTSFTWNKNLDPTGNDTDLDSDNLPDQQFTVGSALLATSLGANAEAAPLAAGQAEPLLQEALARWQAAGADTASLAGIQVRITDLGGLTLGMASGNTIWLDDDAVGWGWFLDPTPHDDSEFTTPGDQGEQGRMDLLTVLMHEMGHLLGHEHEDEGVMHEVLEAGTREGITEHHAAIDAVFSAPVGAREHAPAFWGDVLALLQRKKD